MVRFLNRQLERVPLTMRVIAFALWTLFVLYATLKPGDQPSLKFPYFDKVVHFILFSVLAAVTLAASGHLKRSSALTMVYCIAVAILTESAQTVIPGRSANLADLITNFIGISAGYFLTRSIMTSKIPEK